MKKVILLTLAGAISFGSFAQKSFNKNAKVIKPATSFLTKGAEGANYRVTGDGDTVKGRLNFPSAQLDSLVGYTAGTTGRDSGFVFGPNAYGDKGWAERFDITDQDSSVTVLGTFMQFTGRVSPTSTNTINVQAWQQGVYTSVTGTPYFLTGMPTVPFAQQTVPVKNLGVDVTGQGADSIALVLFANPGSIADSFFVGYEPNYAFSAANGDTLSLMSTRYGYRYDAPYFVQNGDTVINVRNVTEYNDGTWNDNTTSDFQIPCHLAVFPIFVIHINPTSVTAITKNELTFFGNYPNPAVNSTNVKFALKKAADVTISIYDMNGRVINTISQSKLSAGDHTIPVETASLAAGTYIYLIRTSNGDGMAAQMSVVK